MVIVKFLQMEDLGAIFELRKIQLQSIESTFITSGLLCT